MKKFYRHKQEFTPREKVVIANHCLKGYEFRLDENYDPHVNVTRGFNVEFRAPGMRDFAHLVSQDKPVTDKAIADAEYECLVGCILDKIEAGLSHLVIDAIKAYLHKYPKVNHTTLHKLQNKDYQELLSMV